MSAWAILPACLGHKTRDGVVTFDPRLPQPEMRLLFTTAHGYGHYVREKGTIRLEMLSGELRAKELRFGLNAAIQPTFSVRINGQLSPTLVQTMHGSLLCIRASEEISLAAGDVLVLETELS
jgi:hypothetical protein